MQEAMRLYMVATNQLMIGGAHITTVIDETVVGLWSGVSHKLLQGSTMASAKRKGKQVRIGARPKGHISARLPAKTLHKERVLKKPSMMKKPSGQSRSDKRTNGVWLWVGVTVGKGNKVYTHGKNGNGLKRVVFRLLPRTDAAMDAKPRGWREIESTVKQCVKKGSHLVFDKWPATEKAIKRAGYAHAPPVNHAAGFRDSETGFHTNDVESENNRIKKWLRKRYPAVAISHVPSDTCS